MKKTTIVVALLLCLRSFSQAPAEITGKWINVPKENTIIQVYRVGDEFQGKIAWAKNNDQKKPIGYLILDHLQYNPRTKSWENGKIHDPNSGKTYSASAIIKPDDTLELYAYMGIKLFGTSKTFKRLR
jgi:uncharacterized protein (DUF2147 family)